MSFRPDIEGLRAIAILLVVAAHAGAPWLAGGFIGVDVFFVLSGFLITGKLVQEATATGRIRLLSFYVRRLRRLLPALLLMLLLVGLASTWLLSPFEQSEQLFTAQMAALWLSNFHFALGNLGPHVCPDGLCRAELDGRVTYRDNQHLSGSFAESLAPEMARALRVAAP